MPNNLVLAKNYTSLLDEVYAKASVTADLTADSTLVKAGANANEICYPQLEVTGLGDYDRNSGYTTGAVDLHWETAKYNYDRGTKITVDVMDDQETFNLAMGKAGAELIRTKVAPEGDAFVFATLAGTEGISTVTATYSDAVEFLQALIEAKNKMDEDEVPEDGRILYATPTLLNGVMALDTTKSREILNSFAQKKAVPQSRFYTAIKLKDGRTTGEETGHYEKAEGGKDINFMIVHKPAVMKHDKHIANDLIPPSINIESDGYVLKYRKYGLVDVYKNKVAGIYLSHKA